MNLEDFSQVSESCTVLCLSCTILRDVSRKNVFSLLLQYHFGRSQCEATKKVSFSSLLLYKRPENYIFSMTYIRDFGSSLSSPTELLMHLPQKHVCRYLLTTRDPCYLQLVNPIGRKTIPSAEHSVYPSI